MFIDKKTKMLSKIIALCSILLLCFSLPSNAKSPININGNVFDEFNRPIVDVNVTLKSVHKKTDNKKPALKKRS